jgi:hypothetical protein
MPSAEVETLVAILGDDVEALVLITALVEALSRRRREEIESAA